MKRILPSLTFPTIFKQRKIPFLPAAAISLILLSILSTPLLKRLPSLQFQALNEEIFLEEMTCNTLNMHYTLADPAAFGIRSYEAVLPAYSREETLKSHNTLKKYLRELEEINPRFLSEEELHTYHLLQNYLNTADRLNQYTYYEEPLSPSSGMQSQLPILLAEYAFRSIRDVEDYLNILSQTGDYFASLLTFETEKKAEGLLMPVSSLNKVAEQCCTILTEESLKKGEHFLQITFEERLQELYEENLITAEEMAAFTRENDTLLAEVLLPAYQNLADGLQKLSDTSIPLAGLASKPEGRAYYETLVQSETGSSRSIQEIYELLVEYTKQEYATLDLLLQDFDYNYLTAQAYEECYELFPLTTSSGMLIDLQERMQGDFPAFPSPNESPESSAPETSHTNSSDSPEASGSTPTVHVKEVAECLQDYCAPAFYLTPPFDDTYENSIYINTKTTLSPIDLYTTLAHEGFPGHLYQTVYSNRLLSAQDCGKVRQLLWYGGYLEGWALYVEFLSFDYASHIMTGINEPEYARLMQIEKHNRSLQLCLYSLLDILIHYDNYSYQDTAELLSRFGITNSSSAAAIYEYIAEEPANYLKYYLGYLEILLLQEKCRGEWQEQYSDYRFHEFFLNYGPADFDTLNDLIAP